MWSKVGVLLFVGVAVATNLAWLPETEYTYTVRSRSLTSLGLDDTYSGVFYRAKLSIKTGNWNNVQQRLTAKLIDVEVTKKHNMSLPEGWESDVKLHGGEKLQLTQQPFHILIKDNAINGLEVTSKMPKWEANLIRGIVSQLQVQIDPKAGCTYNIMEQTVTGEYDTIYEFCGANRKQDSIIYVTKTKNFERSAYRPAVHFGFGDSNIMDQPNTNQMGQFFSKSSVSRVQLKGQLHRFNISSSETVNEISVSPTLTSSQRALIGSKVNVTLEQKTTTKDQYPKPESSVTISIVYEQDSPLEKESTVSKKQQLHESDRVASPLSEEYAQHSGSYRMGEHRNQAQVSYILAGIPVESTEYVNGKLDLPVQAEKLSKQIARELRDAEEIPSQQTLSKFISLARTCSVMDKKQMKQVAEKLYSRQEQGEQRTAWQVYRDAVAESGNRDAFQIIKEWILEKKIDGREAAQIIATIADSVTLPTEKFARDFFEFTKKSELLSQRFVNDSAILACATMMRKVFVNSNTSYLQYPVHNYESFRTEQGEKFVSDDYVPYLTQQLQKAIQQEDNHKMNVYIRALGNVAHKDIVKALDQLWSQNKAPLFQRVQSILAFDKIRKIYPSLAREVLFRIYNSEQLPQEMRVAAVYQLMRTKPTKTMLQQLARNTNTDKHEYVNSAVQSLIREVAQLNNEENREFAENARSAEHFLTEEVYGQQYSKVYLKEFFNRNAAYLQTLKTVGSMDSYIPQTINAKFAAVLGGLNHEIFDVEAITSSVDDLLNFFQLRKYTPAKQQKDNQIDNLDIEDMETEQLQGAIRYKFGGIESLLSFDNETIAALIKEVEHELKEKRFQMNKLVNRDNLFLSAPLESGSVYTYTLDTPTFLRWEGKVSFDAQPSISNGRKIQNVREFKLKSENQIVVSKKLETRLSIVTVFDHHQYSAGFDKNWQINVPVKVNIQGDLNEKKYEAEIEPTPEHSFKFFHFSTWPVLAHRDFFDATPANDRHDTHVIVASPLYNQQYSLFRKTGMAVRVNCSSEHPITMGKLYERYQKNGPLASMLSLFHGEEMDHSQFTLSFDAKESVARKVKVEFGHRNMAKSDIQTVEEKTGETIDLEKMTDNEFFYATIRMEGQESVNYRFRAGYAQDSVKVNKNMFFAYTKESQAQNIKPYQTIAFAKVQLPNGSQLSLKQILSMKLQAEGKYFFCMGERCESQMQGPITFRRSEERKQYLRQQEGAQECLSQEQKLEQSREYAPCDNYTDAAGLFDQVDIKVQHKNSEYLIEQCDRAYEVARHFIHFPVMPFWRNDCKQVQARFAQDFATVNFTALNAHGQYSINFVPLNQWAQRFVAVHPTYNMATRVFGKCLETNTYEPSCIVDTVKVNTFDDVIYSPDFNNKQWHVLLAYNQTFEQTPEEDQRISYAIMARKDGETKEVRVKIMHPKTKGEIATIELTPVGHFKPTIRINEQQQQWNLTEAGKFYNNLIRFYGNNEQEIKVEVANDFYIVYNGQTVRIAATCDKLRGALRGLCGDFDGNKNTPGRLPRGCQPRSTEQFVKAYRYPMEAQQQQHQRQHQNQQQQHQHQQHQDNEERCEQGHHKVADVLTGLNFDNDNQSTRKHPRFNSYGQ